MVDIKRGSRQLQNDFTFEKNYVEISMRFKFDDVLILLSLSHFNQKEPGFLNNY